MQEQIESLTMPVRYMKGVGPRRGEDLGRLGIHTVFDLLYYLPKRYEDRSKVTPIGKVTVGNHETVIGDIVTMAHHVTRRGMHIVQIAVGDGTGFIHGIWFHQPYLEQVFKKGQRVILYGKVEHHEKMQMHHPEYEILEKDEADSIHVGRIVPVYSLTGQITQRYLRSLADKAVTMFCRLLTEVLPTYIRARERLVDVRFAIRNIHFPVSFDNLTKAYQRIVFEEFFFLQIALAIRRRSAAAEKSGVKHAVTGELIEAFKGELQFELTDGQKKAIADIERDMSSAKPMHRLLEGDVASGKTVVAAHALVVTVQNGLQGVIMAPTEVLARQHYVVLSELLMPLGINVSLLVSGIEKKQKDEIYAEIRDGSAHIVVGTHAVIQEGVQFKAVGLVVIDEQHKFGVTQRSLLAQKGFDPHVLVMTATPIPRTLALTVYGDLDISVIKEQPLGRRPVVTYWVEEGKRDQVYAFVAEELKKGRQAYIVYPLIERSERIRSHAATEMYEQLKGDALKGFNVELLHGKMDIRQKDAVMKKFKDGQIDALVSTVVVEVGIDVPNATCMVIENAERFGLSQLHQLRGRIGRGSHESYCILLANPKTEMAKRRIAAIEGTIDGFHIAEEDLNIRGPGEFFGTRQHGLPEIKFGDIIKDFDIMQRARKEAFQLIQRDGALSEPRHGAVRECVSTRYKGKFELAKVG